MPIYWPWVLEGRRLSQLWALCSLGVAAAQPVPFAPIAPHGRHIPPISGGFTLEQMRRPLRDTSVNALPNSKVPELPLLGNGKSGVVVQSVPGDLRAVEFSINTNDMWRVRSAQPPAGATPHTQHAFGTAHRAALGGLMLTAFGEPFVNFTAEQQIGRGRLITRQHATSGGVLTTETVMHPAKQVLAINVSWSGTRRISLNVSTWAAAGNYGGKTAWSWWFHSDDKSSPAHAGCYDSHSKRVGCSEGGGGSSTLLLCASRNSSGAFDSPRQVWGGLATKIIGSATRGGSNAVINVSKYTGVVNDTVRQGLQISAASSVLTFEEPDSWAALITAVATSAFGLNTSGATDLSPLPSAVALADSTDHAQLSAESDAGWERFWSASSVSTPTLPELEYLWYGALFMTKGFASHDPSVPPSGLFGPWVTSDNPAWNGDYTLDYNQEAQFYHVHATNHPELAASYFGSIVAWEDYGRGMAANLAKKANRTCSDAGILLPAHIAPWGYQSYDQSNWNLFNGMFSAMLFINDWEYTRNKTFAKSVTLPLLSGLTAFWDCFLTNETDGRLHDSTAGAPDSCFEGGNCTDPIITLSLLKRVASTQISLTEELQLPSPPSYVHNIVEHLVSFPTTKAPSNGDNEGGEIWVGGRFGTLDSHIPSAPIGVNQSMGNSGIPLMVAFPVFPSEFLDPRNASEAISSIANNTAWFYSHNMTGGIGPQVNWPMIVRSSTRKTAEAVVKGFIADAASQIGPNLVLYAPGGGTENAGLALVVNELLLSSPGGNYIELFPVWPASHPASFSQLRAKGGFLVSASWNNITRSVSSCSIIATVLPGSVVLLNPWGAAVAVRVTCNGARVVVQNDGRWVAFNPPATGVACDVARVASDRS